MTAPTPERRVGEARVEQIRGRAAEVVEAWAPHPAGECIRDSSRWPLVDYSEVRDLALDLQDERAANARLTAEVERLRSVEADNNILSNASIRSGRALVEARAEVERLTKELKQAVSERAYHEMDAALIRVEHDNVVRAALSLDSDTPANEYPSLAAMEALREACAKYRAALSLPTPAPEATE